MVTSELFKLPFLLIFCCYVPSCPAQLSSQIVEQLFILSPKELQYRFPLFPSRIPFGLSTFSTSTAVLISFSQHQCIATATATGACRRSHQTTTISNNPSLATRFSETPIQVRATQVLRWVNLLKVFIVLRISCLEIECKRPFSVSVKIQRGDLTTANRCTSTYCSRWQDRGQRGVHKHYCGTKRYHSIWLKEMLWARIMHAVPPVRAIEFHPVGFHKISSFTNILTSPFLMYSFHHGISFNKLIRNPETIPGGFIL